MAALQDVVADFFVQTFDLPNTYTLTANTNGQLLLSSKIGSLSKKTAVFDNLQHSLISLGQLCDKNCQVMMDKNNLYDFKNEKSILQGNRSVSGEGLWGTPITK